MSPSHLPVCVFTWGVTAQNLHPHPDPSRRPPLGIQPDVLGLDLLKATELRGVVVCVPLENLHDTHANMKPQSLLHKRTHTQKHTHRPSHTYLGQAGLAVHDETPVLSVHAVSHFVLPDKSPIVRGRSASCVASSRSLRDHSTHHLWHTKVHLQISQSINQ